MAKSFVSSQWLRRWFCKGRGKNQGFTLIELLVVTIISATIVTGLLWIVNSLLDSDRRESARSETQREMQMAMDYISTEMREAVYVYTGECLAGESPGCSGLINYLPASLRTDGTPIIAFWKHQPFPTATRVTCAGATPPPGVACMTSSSYALVVYSLKKNVDRNNPTSAWKGRARITRYVLSEFDHTGNLNQGYVNPGMFDNFASWPFDAQGINLQNVAMPSGRPTGLPTGTPDTLVDFVDDRVGTGTASGGGDLAGSCPNDPVTPAADYSLSPSNGMLSALGFANVRSFYACVSAQQTAGNNQDVILYLRGNADGRPGFRSPDATTPNTAFLPTLETRVLNRGVLNRNPSN
jgi:prepilin-type N-terminal cleavage/methylation domain-containing protein